MTATGLGSTEPGRSGGAGFAGGSPAAREMNTIVSVFAIVQTMNARSHRR